MTRAVRGLGVDVGRRAEPRRRAGEVPRRGVPVPRRRRGRLRRAGVAVPARRRPHRRLRRGARARRRPARRASARARATSSSRVVWLLVAVFGAVPYLLAEPQLSRPVDALFESMSGFSTTGSSVVADVAALSRSMAHVAPVHPLDRGRRDHRDVPGRAAAPARRRPPGALQDGDARARDAAGDHDPRERAPLRHALRRDHGARDPRARNAGVDRRRSADDVFNATAHCVRDRSRPRASHPSRARWSRSRPPRSG